MANDRWMGVTFTCLHNLTFPIVTLLFLTSLSLALSINLFYSYLQSHLLYSSLLSHHLHTNLSSYLHPIPSFFLQTYFHTSKLHPLTLTSILHQLHSYLSSFTPTLINSYLLINIQPHTPPIHLLYTPFPCTIITHLTPSRHLPHSIYMLSQPPVFFFFLLLFLLLHMYV